MPSRRSRYNMLLASTMINYEHLTLPNACFDYRVGGRCRRRVAARAACRLIPIDEADAYSPDTDSATFCLGHTFDSRHPGGAMMRRSPTAPGHQMIHHAVIGAFRDCQSFDDGRALRWQDAPFMPTLIKRPIRERVLISIRERLSGTLPRRRATTSTPLMTPAHADKRGAPRARRLARRWASASPCLAGLTRLMARSMVCARHGDYSPSIGAALRGAATTISGQGRRHSMRTLMGHSLAEVYFMRVEQPRYGHR